MKLCLVGIVIGLALFYRSVYSFGMVYGDPQDDVIYLEVIKDILENGYLRMTVESELIREAKFINPVHVFGARQLFNYANAAACYVFGFNELGVSVVQLGCSLVGLLIVFGIGLHCGGFFAGLLALTLASLSPLDVIYATRLTPDVPVATFALGSIYLCLLAIGRRSNWLCYFSGFILGLGYLVKETILVFLPLMLLLCLVLAIGSGAKDWKKVGLKSFGFILIGVSSVILVEVMYYYFLTEHWFFRQQLVSKVYKIKYGEEWLPIATSADYFFLRIKYLAPELFAHARSLLFGQSVRDYSNIGSFYFLSTIVGLLSALVSLLVLLNRMICRIGATNPNALVTRMMQVSLAGLERVNIHSGIIVCGVFLYLFFEFGFLEISLSTELPVITYGVIEKQQRYLTFFVPFLLLISALVISRFATYLRVVVSLLLVTFLAITSLKEVGDVHNHHMSLVEDMKVAANYLKSQRADCPIVADVFAFQPISFFGEFERRYLHLTDSLPLAEIRDAFVVLGGSRGVDLIADYAEKDSKRFLVSVPEHWQLVKENRGFTNAYRNRDLRIYYVPPQ